MKLSYTPFFELLQSFLTALYQFCLKLKCDMTKFVVEKGVFERYNHRLFEELQSLIARLTPHAKHDGINLKQVKIVSNKLEQYKLYEIQEFYKFYDSWFRSYKGILKPYIITPEDLFKNELMMTFITLYIKKDVVYFIFNVLCSDEFIQVLSDMIKIINTV